MRLTQQYKGQLFGPVCSTGDVKPGNSKKLLLLLLLVKVVVVVVVTVVVRVCVCVCWGGGGGGGCRWRLRERKRVFSFLEEEAKSENFQIRWPTFIVPNSTHFLPCRHPLHAS